MTEVIKTKSGASVADKKISDEERFFRAFENNSLGMIIIDNELRITSVNNSFLKIFDININDLLLKNINEIVFKKNTLFLKEIKKVLTSKKTIFKLDLNLKVNEVIKNLDFTFNYFHDSNNNLVESFIIINDITDIENTSEKALELASVVQNSNDMVFKIDTTGTILTWNKSAEKIIGIKEKDIIGKSITNILNDENDAKLDEILGVKNNKKIIISGKTKKGSVIDLEFSISPLSKPKKHNGILIIGRNITNILKKKREIQIYRKAINTASGIAIIDENFKLIYVNDNYCSYGLFKKNEILGSSILDNKEYEIDNDLFNTRINSLIESKIWHGEVELYNKLKDKYWVYDTIIPLFDKHHKSYKYLLIRNNITKAKQIEAALENKEILEQSLKLKDVFLANISHEFRTPLNSVIGFTDLLLESDLNDVQNNQLNLIKKSSNLLLLLINDILDLTKIETGMLHIENKPFNMVNAINEITDLLKVEAKEKKLELNTYFDPKIDKNFIGDPVRLQQIIVNIIKNAIKFTIQGKIDLSIKLKEKNYKTKVSLVEFIIKDTGIGIEKSKKEIIFKAFTQSESYITRNYGGFGLGLAIVSRLVEKFEGHIEVDSVINKGTVFTLTIPFVDIDEEETNHIFETDLQKNNGNKNIKILLVEDNENNQILATQRLNQWGFGVDVTNNGLEALEVLKKNNYDLILMDIQMPLMDGYTLTSKIRNEFTSEKAKIPIIALTAHASSDNIEKAKRIGMNNYIYKPFKPEDLYNKIVNQLNIKPVETFKETSNNSVTKKNQSLIDFDFVFEECLFNEKIIIKYIKSFVKEFEDFIGKVTIASETENTAEIYSLTHKILPSVKSFKIFSIQKRLETIYSESNKNRIINYSELVSQITNIYLDVISQINIKLNELKTE